MVWTPLRLLNSPSLRRLVYIFFTEFPGSSRQPPPSKRAHQAMILRIFGGPVHTCQPTDDRNPALPCTYYTTTTSRRLVPKAVSKIHIIRNSRGSKYPIFEVSGPNYNQEHGFGDQNPLTLGTWTLWGTYFPMPCSGLKPIGLLQEASYEGGTLQNSRYIYIYNLKLAPYGPEMAFVHIYIYMYVCKYFLLMYLPCCIHVWTPICSASAGL